MYIEILTAVTLYFLVIKSRMTKIFSVAKVHIGRFNFYCHIMMEYVLSITIPVNNPTSEFIVVEN